MIRPLKTTDDPQSVQVLAVDQIIRGASCGLNRPEGIRFSPTNNCVVISNAGDSSISFYKRRGNEGPRIDGKPYLTIKDANLHYVHDVDFSPCGRLLAATAREDHSISIYYESEFQHSFYGVSHKILIKGDKTKLSFPASVAFDPRGRQLAVANRQGTGISIFRVPELAGTSVLNLEPEQYVSEQKLVSFGMAAPHGLRFTPDGRFLVALHKRYYLTENAQGNHGISVFRTYPNSRLGIHPNPITTFETSDSCLHSIDFHPDNQYFAVTSENKNVDLFRWQPTLEPEYIVSQLPSINIGSLADEVKGVSFSRDGAQIGISTSNDSVVVYADLPKII